ncbi:MAG TPA: hypothetical protein VK152_01090 [Paludibacter sp.]|nr:hypothetical protein [Paludibacter sp.]
MKKQLYILTTVLLFLFNTHASAYVWGHLTLVNSTNTDWQRNSISSYQLDSWSFPSVIKAYSVATIYVDYQWTIFTNTGDTQAGVEYSIDNSKTLQIHTYFKNISAYIKDESGTTLSSSGLGFSTYGHVMCVVSTAAGGNYQINGTVDNWMENIYSSIKDKRLKEICIPGSHDAGMYTFGTHTALVSECNTVTQSNNTYNQLMLGTRYFDLRPVISGGSFKAGHFSSIDQLGITQGATGGYFDSIVNDINRFTANHKELIIIDISHQSNTDTGSMGVGYTGFSTSDWTRLFDLLKSINSLYIYNGPKRQLFNFPVSEFINGKSAVILLIGDDILTKNEEIRNKYADKGFYYSGDFFPKYDSYANQDGANAVSNDQINKMKNNTDDYFLLAWTATQNDVEATGCALGLSSIHDLANQVNDIMVDDVTTNCSSTVYPNIINTDYIENNKPALLSIAFSLNSQTKDCGLAPEGDTIQYISNDTTRIRDLNIFGFGKDPITNWYRTPTSDSTISDSTWVSYGDTYYVSQKYGTCSNYSGKKAIRIKRKASSALNVTICGTDTFTINNIHLTKAGTKDIMISSTYCDSTVTVTINQIPIDTTYQTAYTDPNTDFRLPDGNYLRGISKDSVCYSHLMSTLNCDSVICTSLKINSITTKANTFNTSPVYCEYYNHMLHIDLSKCINPDYEITLCDIAGRSAMRFHLQYPAASKTPLDLCKGAYIITIIDNTKNIAYRKKILIG